MNTLFKYNSKRQINLIFTLINLYNFIKDYFLQNIDYFEVENKKSMIQFCKFDNLSLSNSLVTFT